MISKINWKIFWKIDIPFPWKYIKRFFLFFPRWPRLRRSWSPKRLRWSFLVHPPKLKLYEAFLSNFSHGVPHHFGSRLEGCWETSHWVDMVKLNKGYVYWKQWNSFFSSATWQVDRFTVGYHNQPGVVIRFTVEVYCDYITTSFIRCSYPSMNQSTRGNFSAQPWSHHFSCRHWSHWRPNHRRTTATQTTANQ